MKCARCGIIIGETYRETVFHPDPGVEPDGDVKRSRWVFPEKFIVCGECLDEMSLRTRRAEVMMS